MKKILALCGGVGGAKLAYGLNAILPAGALSIAVNTGDDFSHLGLHISPDIDTVLYTLAGLNNTELGWGVAGETWAMMQQLSLLNGETWFRLGDKDLALHLVRTQLLAAGLSLTQVTNHLRQQLNISAEIVPMSDDPVRTIVTTKEYGELPFQHYFVKHQCQPTVTAIAFNGASTASINPQMLALLDDPELAQIIICPSNPLLSIDPILALPSMRDKLAAHREKVFVVSPLINGQAIKGPTAKIFQELNYALDQSSIASLYQQLAQHIVIDSSDTDELNTLAPAFADITFHHSNTLMKTNDDKIALANFLLNF